VVLVLLVVHQVHQELQDQLVQMELQEHLVIQD